MLQQNLLHVALHLQIRFVPRYLPYFKILSSDV